jgi:hypothetical protein
LARERARSKRSVNRRRFGSPVNESWNASCCSCRSTFLRWVSTRPSGQTCHSNQVEQVIGDHLEFAPASLAHDSRSAESPSPAAAASTRWRRVWMAVPPGARHNGTTRIEDLAPLRRGLGTRLPRYTPRAGSRDRRDRRAPDARRKQRVPQGRERLPLGADRSPQRRDRVTSVTRGWYAPRGPGLLFDLNIGIALTTQDVPPRLVDLAPEA